MSLRSARRRAGRPDHRRQPPLLALALCLFLVVGVPILVLVTVPGAHADDSWATPGEGLSGQAVGGDPGTGELSGLQAGTRDRSTPAEAGGLADARAAARQTLTAAAHPRPQPEVSSDA